MKIQSRPAPVEKPFDIDAVKDHLMDVVHHEYGDKVSLIRGALRMMKIAGKIEAYAAENWGGGEALVRVRFYAGGEVERVRI